MDLHVVSRFQRLERRVASLEKDSHPPVAMSVVTTDSLNAVMDRVYELINLHTQEIDKLKKQLEELQPKIKLPDQFDYCGNSRTQTHVPIDDPLGGGQVCGRCGSRMRSL